MRRANVLTAASALALACASGQTEAEPAQWLSQTKLYSDIQAKRIADDMLAYQPAFALWSDGAHKQRWLYVPDGERIDSSDMDHWRFPIGTIAFKEFSREGKRIETRMIERVSGTEYRMAAFVWNDDESDARLVPDGQRDVRGTGHDVPGTTQCGTCHNGEPGKLLGFSAVQQPAVAQALLSHPPPQFAPPGDPITARALGYLHANCAHCHNPSGSARPDTDMNLRLSVRDRTVSDTSAYRSAVDQPVQSFAGSLWRERVAAGDPDASAVVRRMSSREARVQMPPLGSEHSDPEGVAAVRAWIAKLAPRSDVR